MHKWQQIPTIAIAIAAEIKLKVRSISISIINVVSKNKSHATMELIKIIIK